MSFNNTHADILIAGATAAFAIDLLVYPLDTIKTRFQSPDYRRLYTSATSHATRRPNRALFRGLYQGVGSVILATVPSAGAFFTTYEASKASLLRLNSALLPPHAQLPTPLLHSAASCAGECVSCLILTPAEVLKQNAQVLSPGESQRGLFDASATRTALARIRHPRQLFRGYAALVARNLPFTAMQFPLYERAKAALLERRRRGGAEGSLAEKAAVTAVAAGGAGSVAAVVTTPVDVVKTRIMLGAASDGGGEKGRGAARETRRIRHGRQSGWDVGREVLAREGVRGLFRGAMLRGAWTALGSGLYLGIYESGRTFLENRRMGVENKVFQG